MNTRITERTFLLLLSNRFAYTHTHHARQGSYKEHYLDKSLLYKTSVSGIKNNTEKRVATSGEIRVTD